MKILFFLGLSLIMFSNIAQAQNMYITDQMEFTLRTGPGTDRKILSMIKSDQSVEVMETRDEWTEVKLPDDRRGWVVSRFLTQKIPNSIQLKKLEKEHESLSEKNKYLLDKNKTLESENEDLNSRLTTNSEELVKLRQSYNSLKSESADFLKIKKKYKKSASQLTDEKTRADTLENSLSKLELQKNIKWFLSGAGVLLLGFIIGFSTKRQRKRSLL